MNYRDAPPPEPAPRTARRRWVPTRTQVELTGWLLGIAITFGLAGIDVVRGSSRIPALRIVAVLLLPVPMVACALRLLWPHISVMRMRRESGEFDDGHVLPRWAYAAVVVGSIIVLGYALSL